MKLAVLGVGSWTVHVATVIRVLQGLFVVPEPAGGTWHCDTDWERVQLFDHGAFLSTCDGADGHFCEVECDAGYEASHSWFLEYPDKHRNAYWCHCDSDTNCTWRSGNVARDLGCSATECLSDQPVPNATPCKHRQLGEVCTVECNAGYAAKSGEGASKFKCAATGQWEEGSLLCTTIPNFCRELPTDQHAKFNLATCSGTVGELCPAECEPGFEPLAGGANVYKCGGDGQWTAAASPPLRCEQRCSKTVPAQHAFFKECDERTPGSSCEAECRSGYTSKGETRYTCGQTGQWAGGKLTCTLTGCGDDLPPVTQHAQKCHSAALYGKCDPDCEPGYESSGAAPYNCTRVHDGEPANWTGGSLSCAISLNWCRGATASALTSQNINLSHCAQTVGTECGALCTNGSYPRPGTDFAPTYTCSSDALGDPQWLPKFASNLLVCEKKCELQVPSLRPDQARFHSSCEGLPGRTCQAECAHPFVKRSGNEFVCKNGEWQGEELVCVRPCAPGTIPAKYNASTRDVKCAPCEDGKFSSVQNDGQLQCKDCPVPNANKTLCERCPEGRGPNIDYTVCEVCADLNRNLVSQNGVCQPEQDDLFIEVNVLVIAGLVLVIALRLCCCSRNLAEDAENWFYYTANLIAASVALAFLFVTLELSHNKWGWERACVITTAATWLPIPHIIRRYERSLAGLQDSRSDPRLSEDRKWTGPFGLLLFVFGLADVVIDVWFCVKMWLCGQIVLFVCATATTIVTAMMTWYLGYRTLRSIVEHDQRDGRPAAAWLSNHEFAGPIVVVASSSRLNSMAILRLKIGRWKILDFDDSDNQRYFHFMRNSGMFHYLVEDIPHAMASLAVISAGHSMQCGADQNPTVAKLSLVFSLGSILLGIISKTIQQLTLAIVDDPARWRATFFNLQSDLLQPPLDGARLTI